VPGGTIVTRPGSYASVTTTSRGTEVSVTQGTVQLGGKQPEELSMGQRGLLRADGTTTVQGRGLAHADLVVAVGESLTIHDPSPPTAVRFMFGSHCPAGGTLLLTAGADRGDFAAGKSAVALALASGNHPYELRCLGEKSAAAAGTLAVQQDAGTRPVPLSAPATSVVADGRNYTVLYQNQLPVISLRWPDAPTAGSYSLQVSGPRGNQTLSCAGPQHTFASGALAEGTHRLVFRAGPRTSAPTTVSVRFDASAPRASLETPAVPTVAPGGQLVISGTAMPGWTVEVGGQRLVQDELNRFSGQAMMPADVRAVSVRLQHPTRGAHVYLRRALGAASPP
jgi:hypothetical protein